MRLIKVVILWVFTVAVLSLVSNLVTGSATDPGISPYVLFIFIMIISAIFIGLVGTDTKWKGLKGKKRQKSYFEGT